MSLVNESLNSTLIMFERYFIEFFFFLIEYFLWTPSIVSLVPVITLVGDRCRH